MAENKIPNFGFLLKIESSQFGARVIVSALKPEVTDESF
jgi:hypothetical protein